jgi:adenosylmethionine-8-amino-7-oxononanoate aminotransferase
MRDLIVLGTDTEVGKTTFCLLWLAAFGDEYEYWKPVETGESDSESVGRLVPGARVQPPLARYRDAVAPGLAARREGRAVPTAVEIAAARPELLSPNRRLLIETFGSPLSPLGDDELQIRLIRMVRVPAVLVARSTVGAVGRVLQCLGALAVEAVRPAAVALVGPYDSYAVEQIDRYGCGAPVLSVEPPGRFEPEAIARAATAQRASLAAIREAVGADAAHVGPAPRPASELQTILRRDRDSVWHPYTSLGEPEPPLVVVDARDEFLTLGDGRRVIDGISSWWTILHGHRDPVLMDALADAARRFDHVHFAGVTHEPAVELAELLLGTMPWAGGRTFYSDNGSTAVEVALKMAYQYWCHHGEPQRTRFVGFEDGYHGDTFGAMSVGRDPVFFGRFEPLLFEVDRVPVSAERLDDVLRRRGGQTAAVILEPLVQGAGGMRMHTPAELRAIYEVTRSHGVLFIADEVMTGGGRTGGLWAHRSAGIAPDLVCAGKTLAGGALPLAATLVATPIVAAFDTADRSRTFFHGHSFTAHPLACAVAAANWRRLVAGVGPAPAAMERFWTERLAGLRMLSGVKDVRIAGTIAAVELDTVGGYLATVGRQLRRACLDLQVLLRPLGNVLYAMPPLCTSQASLDQIAEAMEQATASVT